MFFKTIIKKLALKSLHIIERIDDILKDFGELQQDEALMAELATSAGGNQMEYSLAIAQIFIDTKTNIVALG